MTTYRIDREISGSLAVTVEADSLKEAKELLADHGEITTGLCGRCSDYNTTVIGSPVQIDLELDDVDIDTDDLEEPTE